MPDLGPKNNFSVAPVSATNKDILDWMYEGDMVLSPSQASSIVIGHQGESLRLELDKVGAKFGNTWKYLTLWMVVEQINQMSMYVQSL